MIFQPHPPTSPADASPDAQGRTPSERENESPDAQQRQRGKQVQQQGGQGQDQFDEDDRADDTHEAEQGMAGRPETHEHDVP